MSLGFLSNLSVGESALLLSKILLGRVPEVGGASPRGAKAVDVVSDRFRLEPSEELRQKFDEALHRLLADVIQRWQLNKTFEDDTELLAQVVELLYSLHVSTSRGCLVDLLSVERLRDAQSSEGNVHLLVLDTALKLRANVPESILQRDLGDVRFGWLAVYGYLARSLDEGIAAYCRWHSTVEKESDGPKREQLELSRLSFGEYLAKNYPAEDVAGAMHRIFLSKRSEAIRALHILSPEIVWSEAEDFRRKLVSEANAEAQRELIDGLGEMRERLRATSAWFLWKNQHELIPLVTLNAPPLNNFDVSRGIVGYVAETGHGHFTNDVSVDPDHVKAVGGTKSEIAVPVVSASLKGRESVLGVVKLEAARKGAFVPLHIGELQASVSALAYQVRILTEALARPDSYSWHPNVHGWGLSQILRRACEQIAQPACYRQFSHLGLNPTCTIWHADREKGFLSVRGASGYDYEYVAEARLPFTSVAGRMLNASRGDVVYCNPESTADFYDKPKAQASGFSFLIATPIFRPRQTDSKGRPIGVLCIHFYKEDVEALCISPQMLYPASLVSKLADAVGGLIDSVQKLQLAVAADQLRSAIANDSLCGTSTFDSIRKVISSCVEAAGCSIFGLRDGKLVCLSTSGLQSDATGDHVGRACYDVDEERGLTTYLVRNPEVCLRIIDEDDEEELQAISPKLRSTGRFRENVGVSDIGHRRFLGAAVCRSNPRGEIEVFGVIRVIRPPEARPFVKADEVMLVALARLCSDTFGSWRALPTKGLAFHRPQKPRAEMSVRERQALERLSRPAAVGALWTREQLRVLLADLKTCFGFAGASAAQIYFLRESGTLLPYVGSERDTTTLEADWLMHGKAAEHVRRALEENQVLVFGRGLSAKLETSVILPIAIPCTLPFQKTRSVGGEAADLHVPSWARGLLRLDLRGRGAKVDAETLRMLVVGARKVTFLAQENRPIDETRFEPNDTGQVLRTFMSDGLPRLGIDVASLLLRHSTRYKPVAYLGTEQDTREVLGTGEQNSIRDSDFTIDEARGLFWMSLKYSAFDIGRLGGRLRLDLNITPPPNLAFTLMRVHDLWSRCTLSLAKPPWHFEFSAGAPEKEHGLAAVFWEEHVETHETSLFSDPITTTRPEAAEISLAMKRGRISSEVEVEEVDFWGDRDW